MTNSPQDYIAFGQGNLQAIIQSGNILVEGVRSYAQQTVANTQAQIKEAAATIKALGAVKSVQEAVELHTSLTRNAFETARAEVVRLTEASVALGRQVTAPIAARVAVANETFARAV